MELPASIKNDITSLGQSTSCNLRGGVIVTRRNVKTNNFGFMKLSNKLKYAASLNIFEHKFKKWTPKIC